MKKALLILALPLAQLVAVQAFAADMATPAAKPTRAEVKEDAKAAVKSGETAKSGEAGAAATVDSKAPVGTKTRVQVKEETKTAAKAGTLPKTGEAGAAVDTEKKPAGTKSRAEVKAEAKDANKAGTVKIGEDTNKGK